jgi:hypothetical protein
MAGLDLTQLQKLIDSAQHSESIKSDLKRTLRKLSTGLQGVMNTLEEAEALLSDDYAPKDRKGRTSAKSEAIDPEAPHGRRKDGTPRSQPGQKKRTGDAGQAE